MKMTTQERNGQKIWADTEETRMGHNHINLQFSLLTREMQTQTTKWKTTTYLPAW